MKARRTSQKHRAGKKRVKKNKENAFAEIEGAPYTGSINEQTFTMGKGMWKERRRNARAWDIFAESVVTKTTDSPSSLPAGSEHHAYILAHQTITKTRKHTYTVRIEGVKFKLAHKEAGGTMSANALARKNFLIKMLKDALHQLEMGHGRAPSQTRTVQRPATPGTD